MIVLYWVKKKGKLGFQDKFYLETMIGVFNEILLEKEEGYELGKVKGSELGKEECSELGR